MNIEEFILDKVKKGVPFNELLEGDFTKAQIIKTMKSLKVSTFDNKLNKRVFKNIDTEEKAYWLGFIYADGCLHSSKSFLEIGLKRDDKEHLYKFQKFLELKRDRIRDKNVKLSGKEFKSSRFMLGCKELYNDLLDKGVCPKKSLIKKFPNINIFDDADLIRHFIRGYFDGNGSISFKDTLVRIDLNSTLEFLEELVQFLPHYSLPKNADKRTNKVCGRIYYSSQKAVDVLNYLYNNSNIYLERKYNLYKIAVLNRNI